MGSLGLGPNQAQELIERHGPVMVKIYALHQLIEAAAVVYDFKVGHHCFKLVHGDDLVAVDVVAIEELASFTLVLRLALECTHYDLFS